jgi:superoxide dismutase, Cu-Zn family
MTKQSPRRAHHLHAHFSALSILLSIALAGCQSNKPAPSAAELPQAPTVSATALIGPSKSATTMPANSNVTGSVTFTQRGHRVLIIADISGLEPNTRHGIHIHEFGDLSAPDLSSAGGHFNPYHHQHGAPSAANVHAGDLGNLSADAAGNAHLELIVTDITIDTSAKDDIVGKSVIIHANPDDEKTQPSGNSGPRIAGGVITLSK